MASNTTHLKLLKKNVVTDGNETFNIETMLNENWDKIDAAFGNVEKVTNASITKAGIVQLTNDIGTSETLAVTQKALKVVSDVVSNEITEVTNKVVKIESEKNLSKLRTNKDAEGIYTTVTYKRKADNTIYCISTLSGGTTPLYTTRTEQYYDAAGSSVIETLVYSLSYDDDGNIVGEV